MRLPKRVVLPFGYVVSVKQRPDSEMEGQDGLWDVETRTISIRKSLPLRRRRYILIHELGHALWDSQHQHLDCGYMKV